MKDILVFSEKHVLKDLVSGEFYLVKGSIVSSGSYFKRQTAGLKSNFGGRLGSMESFMDIGRREAVLRMKEQARIVGANIVFNVRFETVMIRRGKGLCAEFLVYGTAWKKIARADTKSTKTL
ncbi:MAG: YbjQ family protein [Campylobacteraceae bacterium]|nr:YbjQ family protein [Campylobacteraceae bacterium]